MHTEDWQRFVILEHDHPFLHWDLLIQNGSVLNAWRLLQPVHPGKWIAAETLPEHRLLYLDYEGPVSQNRGSVRRLVQGQCCQVSAESDSAEPNEQRWRIRDADGIQLAARRQLPDGQPQWRFE
ncbi:MAG: DNA polymerase ligase N-terminal domain-containing protein [Planctomycetaceae bacterium]